jgi:hypothetical protein
MKIIFIIIIAIHGIIHLFGFLTAFNIAEFKALTQIISKPLGLLWLAAFILFTISATLFTISNKYWWLMAIIAVVVSQILIFYFWKEAKYGTILNILILLVSVVAFANFNFSSFVHSEVSQMSAKIAGYQNNVVSDAMVTGLPVPVQKWLRRSGVIGSDNIQSVYLKQEAFMKLKPEQKEWYKAKAEQYFLTQEPAFHWTVDVEMNPLIRFTGRDKFEKGKGGMLIKILALFPVVNVKENEKINQGALQRYLAEIVWFPSAALSQYITWENMDQYSAKATITSNGTTGSGVFYFNENGDFIKFRTMRYRGADDNAQLEEWIVEASKSEVMSGIRIPVDLKATWKLKDADWTWLKLKITDIQYNMEKIPVANNNMTK